MTKNWNSLNVQPTIFKKITHIFPLSENSAFDIFWLDQILSMGVSNLEDISGDNGGTLF